MNDAVTFYTIDETRAILRCGRSLLYELIAAGKIKVTKLCGKSLIRKDHLDAFIASLGV